MSTYIKNAAVLIDGGFVKTDIKTDNGFISGFGCFSEHAGIDASGLYAIPGFVDTHLHGAVGVEFSSPSQDFDKALEWELSQGITTVCPTTRTLPFEKIQAAVSNISRQSNQYSPTHARVFKAHLEGPFVNPKRKGAMFEEYMLLPDLEFLKKLLYGVCIVTLAPELDGAFEAGMFLNGNGVCASMGHSDADYEQAKAAAAYGFTRATHLFNAMRPLTHREPGIIGACLNDDRIMCELICDMVHVSAAAVMTAIRAKGIENICLVSDSGVMSGCGDGVYNIDGRRRFVRDGICTLENGTIAGSCVSLYSGVKNLYALGFSIEEISVMASKNPARSIGLNAGELSCGKFADILLVNETLDIVSAARYY